MTEGAYLNAKTLPDNIGPRIKQIASELGINTPIADHTSCAMARLTTEKYGVPAPDRMAYWVGSQQQTVFEKSCATYCSPKQMEVCKAKSNEDPARVIGRARTVLDAIGYPGLEIMQSQTQQGKLLIVGGSLPFEEVITIKQAAGWAVSNLPFREAVEHRSRQVLEEELGLGFEDSYAGAVLVGEEWHVFLNGSNLDGVDNRLITRWLRHQNRARIQIVNTEEIKGYGTQAVVDRLTERTFGLQTREEIESQVNAIATVE